MRSDFTTTFWGRVLGLATLAAQVLVSSLRAEGEGPELRLAYAFTDRPPAGGFSAEGAIRSLSEERGSRASAWGSDRATLFDGATPSSDDPADDAEFFRVSLEDLIEGKRGTFRQRERLMGGLDFDSTERESWRRLVVPRAGAEPAGSLRFQAGFPVRQSFQRDGDSGLYSTHTRLMTGGGIKSSGADFWVLEWSSELSYKDGSAPWDSEDLKRTEFSLQRMTVARQLHGKGFLRAGYRLSPTVGGVGAIDGAQGEITLGRLFRLGALAGFHPDRRDEVSSLNEPTGMAYLSAEIGDRGVLHYAGSVGLLGSIYKGKLDRLAYILEQRAELSSKLILQLSSEVDVDSSVPESRNVFRLTRTKLEAASPVSSSLTFRAGFDHRRRPDTRAERDLVPSESDQVFEEVARRYWFGADCRLPWDLQMETELSYLANPGEEDFGEWWRVSITRRGMPGFPEARVATKLYNLEGSGTARNGGSLSASIPLLARKLSLDPGVGFRFLEPTRDFRVTDCSFRATWRTSDFQSLQTGIFYSLADTSERTFLDVGVQCIW